LTKEVLVIRSPSFTDHHEVVCGISTRHGGVSPLPYGLNLSFNCGDNPERVQENQRRFFGQLGIGRQELAIPQQRHTSTVRMALTPGVYPDCDALVTDRSRVFLVVSVADCIPLMMYDPVKKVVAAVHIGWRGAACGIITNTIEHMRNEFSTAPDSLMVFLGPSARACCYEVGEDVASKFPKDFLSPIKNGKYFLDLQGFTKAQLTELGLPPDQIEDDGRCTICRPELFHSYRRDGEKSGRMMGVIGLAS
jgi:YfiH family protein